MAAVTALKHFRILQTRGLIQQCIKCKSTTTSSPTHYDTLGVSRSATAAEIKNAYIKKTKVLHPDKSKNGDNEELYKVQEAYNILSKEKDKKEYDSMIFAVEDYHRYRQMRAASYEDYDSGPSNTVHMAKPKLNIFKIIIYFLFMLWAWLAVMKVYRDKSTSLQIAATKHDWDRPITHVIKEPKQP